MELNIKLYKDNDLLLNENIDGFSFNHTYIKISDKYLKIKQSPSYYENSKEGLRLRLNRNITSLEIEALKKEKLNDFELQLIKYLDSSSFTIKNENILSFFNSMHNDYYDDLEEIYEFYLDNKSIIKEANLLIITKLN